MRTRINWGASLIALLLLAFPAAADEGRGEKPLRPSNSVETKPRRKATGWENVPLPPSAKKGVKWLIVSQNRDGGWNTNGFASNPHHAPQWSKSDIGNTSMAAIAILATNSTPRKGAFQGPLLRAVTYVLNHLEPMLERGLDHAKHRRTTSQLQGKIGRYAPAFLSGELLLEVDGQMPTARQNARVRRVLRKLVAEIVRLQSPDGSWNAAGGWAPIHSTAYASKTLWAAKAAGIDVPDRVFERVNAYTERAYDGHVHKRPSGGSSKRRKGPSRSGPVTTPSGGSTSGPVSSGAAGIRLYSIGQGIEQLTRTPADRKKHKKIIESMVKRANSEATLKGHGSMGGEEFISYQNINLAMARLGGRGSMYWNTKMKRRMADLQNRDGSWTGYHCITGRTACTAAAVMTIVAERSVPRTR